MKAPNAKPMDLSVVIVSWNTRDLLARCLRSLYKNPPVCTFDVWVVDNSSADGSGQMVRQDFPQAHLIENAENMGFARANNQAIPLCAGRIVLLLNPDTEVRAGALQALVDFMSGHPEAGAAGARILNPDGTLQQSCYPAPTLSRELWRLLHLDTLRPYGRYDIAGWHLDVPRPVDALLGACLVIRRDALGQVGVLDEDYFMYSEEIDLCFRIRRAGWHIYWLPQAVVVHHGGQSTQQVPSEMFLRLYRSKVVYFRKNHGWTSAQAYKLILLLTALLRLALSPLAYFERGPRRRRHLTLARMYRSLLIAVPAM